MSHAVWAISFTSTFLLNSCKQATTLNASVIKVGVVYVGVGILSLKEELAWAIDKRINATTLNNNIVFNLKQYHMCCYVALSYTYSN